MAHTYKRTLVFSLEAARAYRPSLVDREIDRQVREAKIGMGIVPKKIAASWKWKSRPTERAGVPAPTVNAPI